MKIRPKEEEPDYVVTLLPGEIDGVPVPGEAIVVSEDDPGNWSESGLMEVGKFLRDEKGIVWYSYPQCPFEGPDGYIFIGWHKDGEDRVLRSSYAEPASPCTLTAVWGMKYTITTVPMPVYAEWIGIPVETSEGVRIASVIRMTNEAWQAGVRVKTIIITDAQGNVTEITKSILGMPLSSDFSAYEDEDGFVLVLPEY